MKTIRQQRVQVAQNRAPHEWQDGDFIYQERQPDGHPGLQNWRGVAESTYRQHANTRGYEVRRLRVVEDRERQPPPNDNWCVGCSPDDCSGCGPAGIKEIIKGPL